MMKLFIFLLFLIVPYAFAADTRHADKLVPSEIKTVDKEAIEKLDTSKNVNGSLAQKPVINSKQLANKTDIITSAGTTQSTNQVSSFFLFQCLLVFGICITLSTPFCRNPMKCTCNQ